AEECFGSRPARHSDEAALYQALSGSAGFVFQSPYADRCRARPDEKSPDTGPASPGRQQRSFRYCSQACRQDVPPEARRHQEIVVIPSERSWRIEGPGAPPEGFAFFSKQTSLRLARIPAWPFRILNDNVC